MKSVLSTITLVLLLSACGVDTAATAVTGAELKQQELEHGKQTMDQIQQKLDQVQEQVQQRAAAIDDQAKLPAARKKVTILVGCAPRTMPQCTARHGAPGAHQTRVRIPHAPPR